VVPEVYMMRPTSCVAGARTAPGSAGPSRSASKGRARVPGRAGVSGSPMEIVCEAPSPATSTVSKAGRSSSSTSTTDGSELRS
jgi:hypothetical protein